MPLRARCLTRRRDKKGYKCADCGDVLSKEDHDAVLSKVAAAYEATMRCGSRSVLYPRASSRWTDVDVLIEKGVRAKQGHQGGAASPQSGERRACTDPSVRGQARSHLENYLTVNEKCVRSNALPAAKGGLTWAARRQAALALSRVCVHGERAPD